MKVRIIILGIIATALTFFFACTKEEDPIVEQPNNDTIVNDSTGDNDEETPSQFYIGEYDILVTTDSVMSDGTWFETGFIAQVSGKTYPDQIGHMTIAATDDPNKVSITSQISGDGVNNLYDYYVTTGTINEAGELVLENSTSLLGGETPIDFEYEVVSQNSPLVFKTHAYYMFGTVPCGYVHTNTATKVEQE